MRRYRKTLSLLSAISLLLFAMCGKDEETGPVTGAPGQEKHIQLSLLPTQPCVLIRSYQLHVLRR